MRTAALLAALALSAPAQEVVWQTAGTAGLTRMGGATAYVGDLDGDGYRDLITICRVYLGAPIYLTDTQLWLLSGRDGRPFRSVPSSPVGVRYWSLDAAGDVNQDGTPDYVVSVVSDGASGVWTEVHDGRDDHVIWRVQNTWQSWMGDTVVGNLDLLGDGHKCVVATAPGETPYGVVYAFDYQGTLLYRLVGTPQFHVGSASGSQTAARVGDVDGDGADDFVVGAYDATVGLEGAALFSGRTGRLLRMGMDERPGDQIGSSMAGCGDLDGDGVPDFAAGNWALFQEGVVRVFSGRTAMPLWTWRASAINPCFSGSALLAPGDLDLDGIPDLIAASPGCGSFWVFSGRDGSILYRLLDQRGFLGAGPAALGRQPDSPFPHFVFSQPDWDLQPRGPLSARGRILDYRLSPPGLALFGQTCGARPPRMGALDLGDAGVRLTLHDAPPSAPTALIVGLSRTQWGGLSLPYPLAFLGLPGCSLYVAPDLALVTTTGQGGIAAGYAQLQVPLQLSPGSPREIFAQWLSLGTMGALSVSDAVAWRY